MVGTMRSISLIEGPFDAGWLNGLTVKLLPDDNRLAIKPSSLSSR